MEREITTNYDTQLGNILNDLRGRELLSTLDAYLMNNTSGLTERFTKDQYNEINRKAGHEYVKELTISMHKGEVSKADVLRVNKRLSALMWEHHNNLVDEGMVSKKYSPEGNSYTEATSESSESSPENIIYVSNEKFGRFRTGLKSMRARFKKRSWRKIAA